MGTVKDRATAYKYYCRAFDGDSENRAGAAYRLGLCHLKGIGTAKNEKKAFEWFETGSNEGSAEATYMLGECYYFGVGVAADAETAVEHFLKAEKVANSITEDTERFVPLYLALGKCFEMGIGTDKDPVRAIGLYKKAAESDVDEALYQAGRAITQGVGMKAEYAAARPLILRAARQGYIPAMLMMGVFADEGRGMRQSDDDARSWYFKAANTEIDDQMSAHVFPDRFAEKIKLITGSKIVTQYRLGMMIGKDNSNPENVLKAFECISLSASMGYAPAQHEITRIYACGGDLLQYYNSADFMPESRFDRHEDAPSKETLGDDMNKLGNAFFDGEVALKKDENAAARCYKIAAELGHIDASYNYGWC